MLNSLYNVQSFKVINKDLSNFSDNEGVFQDSKWSAGMNGDDFLLLFELLQVDDGDVIGSGMPQDQNAAHSVGSEASVLRAVEAVVQQFVIKSLFFQVVFLQNFVPPQSIQKLVVARDRATGYWLCIQRDVLGIMFFIFIEGFFKAINVSQISYCPFPCLSSKQWNHVIFVFLKLVRLLSFDRAVDWSPVSSNHFTRKRSKRTIMFERIDVFFIFYWSSWSFWSLSRKRDVLKSVKRLFHFSLKIRL